MKRCSFRFVFACHLVIVMAAGAVNGQDSGYIVGWGTRVMVAPSALHGIVAVSAGGSQSLALKSDGTIMAWGDNTLLQCAVPSPNANFAAVAGGGEYSVGLKSDGTIVRWGQLEMTVPVPPNEDYVAVAAGVYHILGLKSDGSIAAWGVNNEGVCNVPSPNANFVAVAAGGVHSLGL